MAFQADTESRRSAAVRPQTDPVKAQIFEDQHHHGANKPNKPTTGLVREKGPTRKTEKVKKAVRFAGELVLALGKCLTPRRSVCVEEVQGESCTLRSALKRPGALPKPPKQVRFDDEILVQEVEKWLISGENVWDWDDLTPEGED